MVQTPRMALVVEQDIALDPIHIDLLGAVRVMPGTEGFADTFDKLSASKFQ
jgi:hypothetical protein